MEHLIKFDGAVTGFSVRDNYIYCICRRTVYKAEKESGKIVLEKEIFEKDGLARILIADEKQVFISDFCTLYVLNEEDFEVVEKRKIGEDLSSDICGMAVDETRVYCSVRNGKIVTVEKGSFAQNEYEVSDASMWSLKVYGDYLLCGTVSGQLAVIKRDTMSVVKRLNLSRQNVRSLYVDGTVLYAACQDKKLFKVGLADFEVIASVKNVHRKMFDCAGVYGGMLVTVSYPCGEVAFWDLETLEKRREFTAPLSLSGNAYIEGEKMLITSRSIDGVGIIDLGDLR